jgi:glycosyltransferase involved in cell wall biosynthesis
MQLLARALQKKGIDIQVVAFEYPFRDDQQHWHGIPVVSANGQNRRWLRWRTWSRVFRYAEAIIRTQKVDVIHSFWLGPAWVIGKRLAQKWQIPHWTTLMGQDARSGNRYLRRLQPGDAARLVALSPFHAEIFTQNTRLRPAHLIPWGVDTSEMPSASPTDRPLDVLGVGSLIPVKNWDKWLHTIALAKQDRPGLRAELIGDGVLRARLEKKARQLGLSETLHFAGNVPRPEVLTRMQQAKVLLHTSDYESFGFVLPEAAMNGCRLVATPVGIAPEMADCADNPEELSKKVLEALQQAPLPTPVVPYTIKKAADDYQRLYRLL